MTDSNTKSFKEKGSPKAMAVSDLEASLRQIEKDAAEGKIKDGYNILSTKK